MVYQWKGRSYGVNANIVGQEVEKIEQAKGSVQSNDLVDAARPDDSKLHSLFEWDDSKAAEQFRNHQATKILCALFVTSEENGQQIISRAYFNVSENANDSVRRKGTFVNAMNALSSAENRELILKCAIRDLQEIKRKYHDLKELETIFNEIEKLEEASA